ncbi:NBR1-Ig-like domain-containing protein [Undibacterium sp. Ji83W]|uniref:NBR1-Ig-like domain-containing protein n=1 Tax=Undibacterium sp. Ji83W TaxID=3413043 RepID=UPI003BF28DAF
MSMLDLANYLRQLALKKGINDSELARRTNISRNALIKIFNAEVKSPELTTLANLAYALDELPWRLVSLFLAGTCAPSRDGWKTRAKKDDSRFIRDVNYPDGSMVKIGEQFTKTWEIANGGETAWLGRKLVCQDQTHTLYQKIGNEFVPVDYLLTPKHTEITIPETLPGKTVALSVEFQAPNSPALVVSHWKMSDQEGQLYFPEMHGLRCCVNVIEG